MTLWSGNRGSAVWPREFFDNAFARGRPEGVRRDEINHEVHEGHEELEFDVN